MPSLIICDCDSSVDITEQAQAEIAYRSFLLHTPTPTTASKSYNQNHKNKPPAQTFDQIEDIIHDDMAAEDSDASSGVEQTITTWAAQQQLSEHGAGRISNVYLWPDGNKGPRENVGDDGMVGDDSESDIEELPRRVLRRSASPSLVSKPVGAANSASSRGFQGKGLKRDAEPSVVAVEIATVDSDMSRGVPRTVLRRSASPSPMSGSITATDTTSSGVVARVPEPSMVPEWFPDNIKLIFATNHHGDALTFKELSAITHYRTIIDVVRRRKWKSYIEAGQARWKLQKIVHKLRKEDRKSGKLLLGMRTRQYEDWKQEALRRWKKLEKYQIGALVLDELINTNFLMERVIYKSELDARKK